MSSPESIGKTEQDQQKKRTRIGKLVPQALKGTAELIGVVFTGDDEALLGLFRKDVENPWESESGYVDTRVNSQGEFIDSNVREYVKRHKLTYPESAAMGALPPFGRYWDEKKD